MQRVKKKHILSWTCLKKLGGLELSYGRKVRCPADIHCLSSAGIHSRLTHCTNLNTDNAIHYQQLNCTFKGQHHSDLVCTCILWSSKKPVSHCIQQKWHLPEGSWNERLVSRGSLPETKTSENSWFENYISFPSTTTPHKKKTTTTTSLGRCLG